MRPLPSLLLAALMALAAAAPARAEPPLPQIAVTGEGRVEAAPDMATVRLGVTVLADSAAQALAANSQAVAKVLENLRAAGVEARDIQTSGLSVSPNWNASASGGAPRIEGYTAQNMVRVRMRALDRLGPVLDAAVQDGANTLDGLSFDLADPAPLMDEARRRAVADARHRAELLAAAAGVRLGRILSIAESGGMAPPVPMFRAEAAMGAPPVAGGEIALAASVTIVWEIAQ